MLSGKGFLVLSAPSLRGFAVSNKAMLSFKGTPKFYFFPRCCLISRINSAA
jgi:hypothetical protein